jgi:hypothetical protein
VTGIFIHLQLKRTVLGPVDRGNPVSGPRSRFLNFNLHRLYKLNKKVCGESKYIVKPLEFSYCGGPGSSRVSPCGICDGQGGTGPVFSECF